MFMRLKSHNPLISPVAHTRGFTHQPCKLPLLLTAFLFAGSFPASASAVCLAKNYTIASRGDDGRSGADGRNETVIANGSAVSIDLSGTVGQDGRDGSNNLN